MVNHKLVNSKQLIKNLINSRNSKTILIKIKIEGTTNSLEKSINLGYKLNSENKLAFMRVYFC